jgi:hypothetical protein
VVNTVFAKVILFLVPTLKIQKTTFFETGLLVENPVIPV